VYDLHYWGPTWWPAVQDDPRQASWLRVSRAAMGQPETNVQDLCAELGITRQTLYRFVSPTGELRDDAERLLLKRRVAGRPN
jgi:hypothetical protein